MKNKFLLLGATALLSTGLAIGVMADDEPSTTTLKASAEIVVADMVVPVQDIDFGRFMMQPSDLENDFIATMNPETGVVTSEGTSHSGGKNGQVIVTSTYSSPKKIQIPTTVWLTDYEGHLMSIDTNFVQIGNNSGVGPYIVKTYGIGGTLRGFSGYNGYGAGVYTGELTVTVIEDTGA